MNKTIAQFAFATFAFIVPFAWAEDSAQPGNVLTEGSFETVNGDFYAGWGLDGFLGGKPGSGDKWNNHITMNKDDKGVAYAHLECLDPEGANLGISQTQNIVLNPAWKSLDLRGEVRTSGYKQASDWGGRIQLKLTFFNSAAAAIDGEFYVGLSENKSNWELLKQKIEIPPGATAVKVSVQIIGANVVADVRNLSLVPH